MRAAFRGVADLCDFLILIGVRVAFLVLWIRFLFFGDSWVNAAILFGVAEIMACRFKAERILEKLTSSQESQVGGTG